MWIASALDGETQTQYFLLQIAPDFSDTSAARKFFHQYPASSRSLQDYLRSAPPAVALEALLDGVFDGDASKSGLGPYIVDRPEASTVPDLGTVGCVVGYKSQVDAQTLRRQRPTMVCDELPVSDPSTVEWAFGPTFYGQGCVPNDTCERAEPCADGNSDGEIQQSSSCSCLVVLMLVLSSDRGGS